MKKENTKLHRVILENCAGKLKSVFPVMLLVLMGSVGIVTALIRTGGEFQITNEEFNGGNSISQNKFHENQSTIGLLSSFNTLNFTFPPDQDFQNPANVLSGGGNISTSDSYTALSTIGQSGFVGIHSLADSHQEIHQGFWPTVSIAVCPDLDGDGFYGSPDCGTKVDCDDSNAEINPDATEICDGVDNNCNDTTDEGCCLPDGDVNEDSAVTPVDALMTFEHYLGVADLSICRQSHADINQDGSVTPADAVCIFQKYMGLPSCEQ